MKPSRGGLRLGVLNDSTLRPPSSLRIRSLLRAIIAITAATVVLVGCTTSTDGPVAPSVSPEPSIPLGHEWVEVPLPDDAASGIYYEGFSAGGAFWIYDPANAALLHGTKDGKTWRTIDVVGSGVTPPDGTLRPVCQFLTLDSDQPSTFSVMYETYYGQGHPASLNAHGWILEVGPENVSLSDGATNGLEVMPSDEGGYAYRTECAWGMEYVGGKRVIVGDGQWWQPWETGNVNPYVAVEDDSGKWKVHASSQEPFFKDQVLIMHVTKAADRIVVFAFNSAVESGIEAWSSSDAFHWDRVELPGPKPGGGNSLPELASNERGMAAWTTITSDAGAEGHVWTTRDGAMWTHTKLFDKDWQITAVRIDEEGFAAHAYRLDGEEFVSNVWHSADGETWTAAEDSNPYPHRLKSAVLHEGGLVLVLDDMLLVSGMPWGTP